MYPNGYGYPGGMPMSMGMQPMGVYGGGAQVAPGYVVQQTPGHSVVIQPGMNGQPTTVTQIPGTVSSA